MRPGRRRSQRAIPGDRLAGDPDGGRNWRVLGALLGSAVGAWIAIGHSRSVRRDDQERHIKERTAELITHLTAAYRVVNDYYKDRNTGRNEIPNEGIRVKALPETFHKEEQGHLAAASAVLEYLSLVATTKLSDTAKRAATKTNELFTLVSTSDFMETDYREHESKFQTAKSDLVLLVSPDRR